MKKVLLVICYSLLVATLAKAQATRPAIAPAGQSAAPPSAVLLAEVAKPTSIIARESCVTAECHANVKQYKVLHGPVNVNACDACHKLTDPAQHKFELSRNKSETCTFCHQLDMRNNPVVHKPVTDGQCLSCHNPHGGVNNKFTRGKTTRDLCATCHKDPVGDQTHVHGPVAAGACDSCHSGHSSKFPKLLPAQGRDLCLTCHNEMKTQMASAKVVHKAVEGDCNSCHSAHASNYTMQIKSDPLTLCTSCHEHDKIKSAAMTATFKHSPVVKDASCLNCHTAHGGDLAKLMRAEPIKVCMKCHTEDQKAADGHVVHSVSMVLDPNMSKHGPIRDGNCSGCHNPHGSAVPRLLAKPYPQAFYQAFSEDKYELCFSCHDKQLVETPKTANLTGFRNGDRNLHFVHVNKEKGRNCRSCHETHASVNERHIRNSVPFGQWEMPLKFTKLETGGSCSPGCHKPFTYDRDKPVNYQMPGSGPAPTAPLPTPSPAPAQSAPIVTVPQQPIAPTPPGNAPGAVAPPTPGLPPAVVPPPTPAGVAPPPVPAVPLPPPSATPTPPGVVPPPVSSSAQNSKTPYE